jgi:hypothetical protein
MAAVFFGPGNDSASLGTIPPVTPVTRILVPRRRYILTKKDKDLTKWWARYCESNGETEKALDCYQAAEDYLSLVRVHCLREEFDIAREIAMESGNLAAAYHLGRQFENQVNGFRFCSTHHL